MRYLNSFIGFLLMSLLVVACGERQDTDQERFGEDGTTPTDEPTQTQPPSGAEQDETMTDQGDQPQQEFVEQMELRLDQAEQELDQVRQDEEGLGEQQDQETQMQYDQIEERINEARDQISELEDAGSENWEQMSQQVMNEVNSIEEDIQSLSGSSAGA